MSDNKKYDRLSEALESILEQGEIVSWKGEPAKVKLLEAPQGVMLILRWAVCFIVLLFMLWFGLIYNSDVDTGSNVIVFLVLVFVALAYISVRPIVDAFTIERNIVYCITNKRAAVLLLKNQSKIKYADYKDVPGFDVDMISYNVGNVYIGSKAPNSLRRSRSDTLTFPGEGDELVRPLVFYNVENPDDIAAHFKR